MALSPVLQLVLFVLCVLQVVIGMREDSLVPRLSVGGERESLGYEARKRSDNEARKRSVNEASLDLRAFCEERSGE